MTASGVIRIRIHVPPHDGWPATVRGVGSRIDCPACGETIRAKSHAAARKGLRSHHECGDCPQATAVLNEHRPDVPPVLDAHETKERL